MAAQFDFASISQDLRKRPMTTSPDQQLLAVMRSRLSIRTIAANKAIAEILRDTTDIESDKAVQEFFLEMVEKHVQPDLREALKLMMGLDDRTRSPRISRTTILQYVVDAIPGKTITSKRGQELIESRDLLPAASAAWKLATSRTKRLPEPWTNFATSSTLRAASEPGQLIYRLTYEFDSNQPHLIIAVTSDDEVADRICATHPDLAEAFVPSIGQEQHVRIDCWFEFEDATVESGEIFDYADRDTLRIDGVQIYAFHCTSGRRPARVRFMIDQRVLVSEGYVYWHAPRRLQLREATIDFSAFPDVDNFSFSFLPSLAVSSRRLETLHRIQLIVGEWINAGSGYSLIWRQRA